jgi:hypothetical protein
MKSSGDVFLIATAINYDIDVITEVSKTTPYQISQICKVYNISCYNLTEFVKKEGREF